MKTATIPSLCVTPELQQAAESVLQNGETLSHFVEQSIRTNIERRRFQRDFFAREPASRVQARLTGEYVSTEDVRREIEDKLAHAATNNGA